MRRRHGGPPPWWPDGEAWPPRGGPHHPAGLLVRLVLRTVGVLLLVVVTVTAFGYMGAGIGSASVPSFVIGIVALVGVAFGLGVVVLGWRRVSSPLDELLAAARRIEAGDYSARIAEAGPRELSSVARAFNAMSARLQESDSSRRSFLADVSHELRTPLTILRGQLEAIRDGVYPADAAHLAPVVDQTAAMERLVEDLRTVALLDAGALVLTRAATDLVTLAKETLEGFRAAADAAGVSLAAEVGAAPVVVEADPPRIRRVLLNLLSNAIRHTPKGGTVTIGVHAALGGGVVEVRDTGPGIAPELLPVVFDRFARGPGSAGTGLGLAIARDLVLAHSGTITAENASGGGAVVRFTLPGPRAA